MVETCYRPKERPTFMEKDPGEVFWADTGSGSTKLPSLYAPKNWESRLEKMGFFLAKTKKSGWRIKLKDIPIGCWIRKNEMGYEICNYKIIQP